MKLKLMLKTALVSAFFMLTVTALPASAKTLPAPKGVMAHAVKNTISVSWESSGKSATYYVYEKSSAEEDYHLVRKTSSRKILLKNRQKGLSYTYRVTAESGLSSKSDSNALETSSSKDATTTVPSKGKSTILNFLRTGTAPIGSVMYVYGGGWGSSETKTIGLSSQWRSFAGKQTSSYNRKKYVFQSHKGLDCTGFVGFTIYNTLQTTSGKSSYVYKSFTLGNRLKKRGLGKTISRKNVKTHHAGDIMYGGSGHAWISLGQCSDGSTVVLHSQKYGVRLCGTPSRSGSSNSQAVQLAKKYMKKYYPSWYRRYPSCTTTASYNTRYDQFIWSGNVLSDPEGLRLMGAEDVLAKVFGEN